MTSAGLIARPTLVAAAMLASSCASSGLIGGAHTIGEGNTELFIAPEGSFGGSDVIASTGAHLTVGVRHGVTERFDLGGRVWAFPTGFVSLVGGSLDLRVGLLQARNPGRGVDIALMPSVGYQLTLGAGTDVHVAFAHVPVAFGFNLRGGHQIILAPGLTYQLAISESSAPVHFPFGTGTIGFLWRVFDDFWLMPEVGGMWSPTATDDGPGTAIFRGGLGFGFDT